MVDAQDFYEAVRSWLEDKHSIRQAEGNDVGEWERGGTEMLAKVMADLDKLAKVNGLEVVGD